MVYSILMNLVNYVSSVRTNPYDTTLTDLNLDMTRHRKERRAADNSTLASVFLKKKNRTPSRKTLADILNDRHNEQRRR